MSISLNKSQTSGNKKKNKIKIDAWLMHGFGHDKKIMRGSKFDVFRGRSMNYIKF